MIGLFVLVTATALAKPWTPESVANHVIEKTPEAQIANAKLDIARVKVAEQKWGKGIQVSLSVQQSQSKLDSAQTTNIDQQRRFLQSLSLEKTFLTGTTLLAKYSRDSARTSFFNEDTRNLPQTNAHLLSVGLTQDLWKNFFGQNQRRKLAIEEKKFLITQLDRVGELQNLVLSSLELYWQVVLKQKTLELNKKILERFEKVRDFTKRKAAVGFAGPGEALLAEAGVFEKINQVARTERELWLAKKAFAQKLALQEESIEVHIPDFTLPPALDRNAGKPIEEWREFRKVQLELEVAEQQSEETRDDARSELKLIAEWKASGFEERVLEAESELATFSRPEQIVGVQWVSRWGDNLNQIRVQGKELERRQAMLKVDLKRQELSFQREDLDSKLPLLVREYESAKREIDVRSRAAREQERGFQQGRGDLNALLDNLNRLSAIESEQLRLQSEIELNAIRRQALTDQLIQVEGL